MFMHVPGLKVVAPSNAHDVKGCDDRLDPRRQPGDLDDRASPALRRPRPIVAGSAASMSCRSGKLPRHPLRASDVTLVGISNMLVECLARRRTPGRGRASSAEVIDPISLGAASTSDTIVESARPIARAKSAGRRQCLDELRRFSAEIAGPDGRELWTGEGPIQMKRMGFAPTTCPTSPAARERCSIRTQATIADHGLCRWLEPEARRPGTPESERAKLTYQTQFRGPF